MKLVLILSQGYKSFKIEFMKSKITLLVCIYLFILTNGNAQTDFDASIIHGGLVRTYRLYIPAKYKAGNNVPLVINLHGYGSNSIQQEFYGDFRHIADTANFIIALPNGSLDSLNKQFFNCLFDNTSKVDDVGFISSLIDTLSSKYSIDKNAIYATGMSNGGFMSYELACGLSNRIAAIASVAGVELFTHYNVCKPEHPMPVLHIHGTNDGTVPYNGKFNWVPVETLVNSWVNFNKCTQTPVVTDVPDISKTDGCTAVHFVYENGDKGSTVEFYKVIGGDHSWPGAVINLNVTNEDFNASKEIWRFFSNYKLNKLTETVEPQSLIYKIYPNPASNKFTINFSNYSKKIIWITNAIGQQVLNFESINKEEELNIAQKGLYFISIIEGSIIKTEKLIII